MIYSKKELEYLSSNIELLNKEILETRGEVFTWFGVFQITVSDDVINKVSKEAYGYILPGLIKNVNEDSLLKLLNTYYKGKNNNIEMLCEDVCEVQYQMLGENNKKLSNFFNELIKSNEIKLVVDERYQDYISLNNGFKKEIKNALKNNSFIKDHNFETIDIIVNNKKIKNNEELVKVIKLLFNRYGRIGRYELKSLGLDLEGFPEDSWVGEDELSLNELITEKDYLKYIKKSGIFNENKKLATFLIEKINGTRVNNSEPLLSLKEIKNTFSLDKDSILDVALSNYGLYLNKENEKKLIEYWDITKQDISNKIQNNMIEMINNTVINNITHIFRLRDEIFKDIITEDFLNKFLINEKNREPNNNFHDFMNESYINKSNDLLMGMNKIIKKDMESKNLSLNKSITYVILTRDFLNEFFKSKKDSDNQYILDLVDELIKSIEDIKNYLGEDFELLKQYIVPLDEKMMVDLKTPILERKNRFNENLNFVTDIKDKRVVLSNDSRGVEINGVIITMENYSENKRDFLNLLKKIEANNLYMPSNMSKMIKEMNEYKGSAEFFEDIVKNDIKILEQYSRCVRAYLQKNFLDDYKKEAIDYLNKGKEVFKKSNENTYVDLMSKSLQYLKKEDRHLLLDDIIEKNIFSDFVNGLKSEPWWLSTKVHYIPVEMEMEMLKRFEDNKDYALLSMWILSLDEALLNKESKEIYAEKIEYLFSKNEIREILYNDYDNFLMKSSSERELVQTYLSKEKLKIFNKVIQNNNYNSSLLIDYYTDKFNSRFRSIEELLKGKNVVTNNEDLLKRRFEILNSYISTNKDLEKLIKNIIESKNDSEIELKTYYKLKSINVADFSRDFYHEIEKSDASSMIKFFVNEKSKTTIELDFEIIKDLLNQLKDKVGENREIKLLFDNVLLYNSSNKNKSDLKDYCLNDDKVLNLLTERLSGFSMNKWFDLVEDWVKNDSFEELCEVFNKVENKSQDLIMGIILDTYKNNYLHTNPEFLIKLENHNLIKNNGSLENFRIPQKNQKVTEWLKRNEDVQAYFEKYVISLNINNQEKKISKKIKF